MDMAEHTNARMRKQLFCTNGIVSDTDYKMVTERKFLQKLIKKFLLKKVLAFLVSIC